MCNETKRKLDEEDNMREVPFIKKNYYLWPSWEAFVAMAVAVAFIGMSFSGDPVTKQIQACDHLDTSELTALCLERIGVENGEEK